MRNSRLGLNTLIAMAAGVAAAQRMAEPGFYSPITPTRRRVAVNPDQQQRADKRAEIKAWNEAVDARKKAKKGTP